jgi:hypothetical protein
MNFIHSLTNLILTNKIEKKNQGKKKRKKNNINSD